MLRTVSNVLDRLAIRSACRSVRCGPADCAHVAEAESLLGHADFFSNGIEAPADLTFTNSREFRFRSPVETPWAENNLVYGKLFRAGREWQHRPSVLLLHGWNGELGYRWQFPWLARRLARAGLNAAMLELPYHARRKPRAAGAITNFISHDLLRMVEATRQAIADTRALAAWLAGQAAPAVGVWGISMGAWLAGLLAGCEPRVKCTVLMSPVVEMDRAVAELAFCEPIRHSLNGRALQDRRLNPASYLPQAGPESVLIVESFYDLFAPPETIEHLWQSWRQPEIWRLPHGHISILMSLPVMERTVRWVARKVAVLSPAAHVVKAGVAGQRGFS